MERNTLLIADDIRINRKLLKVIFNEQYEILEAEDGEMAIKLLEENSEKIALLFLDLQMPKKNGLEVLKFMEETRINDSIPVIMITGEAMELLNKFENNAFLAELTEMLLKRKN